MKLSAILESLGNFPFTVRKSDLDRVIMFEAQLSNGSFVGTTDEGMECSYSDRYTDWTLVDDEERCLWDIQTEDGHWVLNGTYLTENEIKATGKPYRESEIYEK